MFKITIHLLGIYPAAENVQPVSPTGSSNSAQLQLK